MALAQGNPSLEAFVVRDMLCASVSSLAQLFTLNIQVCSLAQLHTLRIQVTKTYWRA